MSRALNYLGIARKAGAIETGEDNSGTEIRLGKAKLLLLASDASDNADRRAEAFADAYAVLLARVPFTKDDISAITGKRGCSMAVFTDLGLASSFASALREEFGDEYLMLDTELKARKAKAASRFSEGRPHEHGKKQGNRRNDA